MLATLRVLDLADEKGFLCGKILAELGADVIKIEPPGGEPTRNNGPFYHDLPDPENSIYWWTYNTSKRGITLNIESPDGQQILKRLVETTDIMIETFDPGYLDKIGLGYSVLSKINPHLILTSITHFGKSGPRKDFKGSDIVDMAMGGLMFVTGYPDRAPVRISFPQAYLHGGLHAAVGTLIAHHHREITGKGQQVDVSIQECVSRTLFHDPHHWEMEQSLLTRIGSGNVRGKIELAPLPGNYVYRENWPCKDGHVGFRWLSGRFARLTRPLVEWMQEEGMAGITADIDWDTFDLQNVTQPQQVAWEEIFLAFFATKTKMELYKEAIKRRILIMPGFNTRELLDYHQLKERDFWVDLPYPELNTTIKHTGAPYKLSERPYKVRHRAPLIGEHNEEVYAELGYSRADLNTLSLGGVI